jgi:hypothetical protein
MKSGMGPFYVFDGCLEGLMIGETGGVGAEANCSQYSIMQLKILEISQFIQSLILNKLQEN